MLDQLDDDALDRYVEAKKQGKDPSEIGEMSFLEHVEVLRWHIIRSVIAVFVLAIAAFLSKDFVFGTLILGPSRLDFLTFRLLCDASDWLNSDALCITDMPFILQSRKMTGQFTMHISSSIIVGFIAAFPYVFWEIWRFVRPGLYSKEKNTARGTVFIVSVLFFIGVLFGYYIISPLIVNFLGHYTLHESIANEFDIASYVGTVTTLVLVCGLMFQLPVVIYFLTKVGIVTPDLLVMYRKHALIVILFLGALLTPPDVTSQVLIAVPLFVLYQFSIVVSKFVYSRRE